MTTEKITSIVTIEEITSIVTTGFLKEDEMLDFVKKHNNLELYVVTDYAVYLGKVSKNKLLLKEQELLPEFVQEIRVFNENEEIKITRQGEGFVWRQREDQDKGNPRVTYIDECHKLWGTVQKVEGEFSILQEQRGATIAIPKKYKEEDEVGLVFRKYIGFQDKDFVTDEPFSYHIVDERLVEYRILKEDKENE